MTGKRWRIALLGSALAVCVLAVAVEPSLAAPSKVGDNIGGEAESWAKALIFPIAALVGIPLLLKRNFAEALGLLALVMVIGSFVYAPTVVRSITTSIAKAIGG